MEFALAGRLVSICTKLILKKLVLVEIFGNRSGGVEVRSPAAGAESLCDTPKRVRQK